MANQRLGLGEENVKADADQAEAKAEVPSGKSPGEPGKPGGIHAEVYRDAVEHAPKVGIDGTKGETKMPRAQEGRRSWRGGK